MSAIFNEDSPFITGINRISDIIILNILFIISCIPVFTIGTAITAMTYTAMHSVKYEDGYVAKRYFKAFKENFKQSTVTWLILLAAGAILFFDVYFWVSMWTSQRSNLAKYMIVFSVIMVCAYIMIFVWIYPIMATFKNTIGKNIWNALALAVRHFPWTLLLGITAAGTVILSFYVSYFLLFLLTIGFATYAYLFAFLFNRVFKVYIEQEYEREAKAAEEAMAETPSHMTDETESETCPNPSDNTDTLDTQTQPDRKADVGSVTKTGRHVTYVNAFEGDDDDEV